jgi:hypothetical protein
MTRISLQQGFYQSRSFIANAQRCLNLYPEGGTDDAPSPTTCYPTPGLTLIGTNTPDFQVRCLYTASNGVLFGVIGANVGYFNSVFKWIQFGTLPTNSGPCYMKDNGIDVVLIDESTFGYSWALNNYSTFAQINDPTGLFVGSVNVEFLDSYFLFSVPNTAQFYCSLSNSLTFDPLYIVSKNGSPDFVAFLAVCQRYIWVLGTKTTELWYDAGATLFPFGEVQGTFFQHGCAAPASVAVSDTHVWWLGQDAQGQGVVYNGSNAQVTRISTHAIEQVISGFIQISDAIGMTYQQQGHTFYLLTFPAADRTFVWDDSEQLWHERCWMDANGFEHRHRANCMANAYGKVVCGDWENGNLYELDLNNYTDNGAPIKRVRGFPHLPTSYDPKTGLSHLEGKRIRYDQFIADFEAGGTPETELFAPVGAPVVVATPTLTIAFVGPPTTGTFGVPLAFEGTVFYPEDAVQIALGTSPTVAPTSGWVNATVPGDGTWSGVLTPGS